MARNKGLLIAGSALLAEGVAMAAFGRRYLEFMARQGMLDWSKRLLRRLDVESPVTFAGIGAAEAVWGLVLLRRATS